MAKKEKEVKEKKQKNTSYFKEMKTELKKVVWPTPRELLNNTVAVISFVIIIAIIVFILDLCFDNLNKYGITKLQEKVQTSFNTEKDDNNQNNEENEHSNPDAVVENNDEANVEESNQEETTNNSENIDSSEGNNEDTVTE